MADLAVILADLRRIGSCFDFRLDGLGVDALGAAARGVLAAMDAEADPDGVPWPDLSQEYADYKAGVAPGEPMAVLYHKMKTVENVVGEQAITFAAAAMTYGVDPEARQEAIWFSEGRPPGQPPRPFYALTAQSIAECNDLFDQRFVSVTTP